MHFVAVAIGEKAQPEASLVVPAGLNNPPSTAGNLARYLNNWKNITSNNFILRIIREGYKLQFQNNPTFPNSAISNPSNSVQRKALKAEIRKNLISGAISKINKCSNQVVSRVFTVKKSNGTDRMIIDLSNINTQIIKIPFKMETYENIREILQPLDFMASVDLQDAFFSIPIHEDSKKFLVFEFENQRYCFNVLPFGLTSSPRIFSKVLRPVIIHLRSSGIRILSYLDDIFLCSVSASTLSSNIQSSLNLLISLGYFPNYDKSHLIPSNQITHLGFVWNSVTWSFSLPIVKVLKTKSMANTLLESRVTLRDLSSFIGLLVSHAPAFPFAPLHYRSLQFLQIKYLKLNVPWDSSIKLDSQSVSDVRWWLTCPESLPSSNISNPKFNITLHTDASNKGWGGVLSAGQKVSGQWSSEESKDHINLLELKAILFCIKSFVSILSGKSLKVLCDNSTSVYYLNKKGGTHSVKLCTLAIQTWDFLILNNIHCEAFHLPGIENTTADFHSRNFSDSNDYSINSSSFSTLISLSSFTPEIDLFASRLTAKLPHYVSWKYDPFSSHVDAFSIEWSNNIYIFSLPSI